MMTLLRAESKGFCEGRVPTEFAGPFDRAATLVPISRGSGYSESRRVEERQRRTAANAHVRISNLLCAQRKTCAGAIIRRSAAEISRIGRSGLPRDDILQPPIAKDVHGPAMVPVAMVLAKRQFVHGEKAHLMAHIEG